MDISVIGASGSVGSEIARQIVSTRLLENNERLQLVGRMEGRSSKTLYGLSTDLMDAYDEICPIIEVILNTEHVSGDLIIMVAGTSAPVNQPAQNVSRDTLAIQNIPIFEDYASALARHVMAAKS